MPTRMERYYKSNQVKSRAEKNQDLYRTIYDEAEYSNVEGISVIERNEKIDINMIKELINGVNHDAKPKLIKEEKKEPVVLENDIEKNYDIRDILSKAKSQRGEKERRIEDTQYNILKKINVDGNVEVPKNIEEDELKNMIDAISSNSKNYTCDLLDDLKTIHDPSIKSEVIEQISSDVEPEIDKSFYTSSLGFNNDDFEDLKEMKDDIKKNTILTKILLFVLLVVIITGVTFLIYHFK